MSTLEPEGNSHAEIRRTRKGKIRKNDRVFYEIEKQKKSNVQYRKRERDKREKDISLKEYAGNGDRVERRFGRPVKVKKK